MKDCEFLSREKLFTFIPHSLHSVLFRKVKTLSSQIDSTSCFFVFEERINSLMAIVC
jgi:hypothetical protein